MTDQKPQSQQGDDASDEVQQPSPPPTGQQNQQGGQQAQGQQQGGQQQGGQQQGAGGAGYVAPPPGQGQQGGQQPPPPPPGQFPPGGQQPPPGTGMPPGQFPPGGQQPPPEDKTPANYKIGKHLPGEIHVSIPAHKLQFDEQKFLHLLAGSISLSKDEKKRIIESIPKLKQEQVDELIRIFEEERRKFSELSGKHVDQLKKLEKQHWNDWQDIEMAQKAGERKEVDDEEADKIRKQLGL